MTTRRCCQEDQALNRLTHTRDSGRVRAVRMEIVATVVISTICWRGGRVRGIFGCSTGKWLGRCTDRDGFLILFLIRRAAHVADVYRSCVRAGSPKRFMIGIAPDQLKICRRVGGPIARAGWPPCNPVVGDLRACNGTDCFDRRFPVVPLFAEALLHYAANARAHRYVEATARTISGLVLRLIDVSTQKANAARGRRITERVLLDLSRCGQQLDYQRRPIDT